MIRLIFILALLASPALAQQSSPSEQALGNKLFQEVNEGLNCNASLISLRAELAAVKADLDKANAQIKESATVPPTAEPAK